MLQLVHWLMIVWWWSCIPYIESLAEVFKLLWNKKLCTYQKLFHWAAQTVDKDFAWFYKVIFAKPLNCLYDQKFSVVIYNTKIMLVTNCEDVSSYRFPWLSWYFMWHCVIFWSYCLDIKACGVVFDCFFYVSICVDPIYWLTCQKPCLLYTT